MNSNDDASISINQQTRVSIRNKFSMWLTLKNHIPKFLFTILFDIIFPLIIYLVLQKYTKPVYALLIASSPPLFMVIFKAVFFCMFDAFGFVIFITFAISGIVAVITRNPIIILLEKSLVTGILSIVFGLTLIPFHCCHSPCRLRPIGYYLYQDLLPMTLTDAGLPEKLFNNEQEQNDGQYQQLQENRTLQNKREIAQVYEWIYQNCVSFRVSCYTITTIWAIGFLLEFLVRLFLILINLPINKIVIYGHLILSSITIVCIILSIISIAIERKSTLQFIENWTVEQNQRRVMENEIPSNAIETKPYVNSGFSVDT